MPLPRDPIRLRRLTRFLVIAGLLLPLGFLFGVTVLGYRSSRALRDAIAWVPYTQKVAGSLSEVLSLVEQIEGESRGYLITGDDGNLKPYDKARRLLESQMQN